MGAGRLLEFFQHLTKADVRKRFNKKNYAKGQDYALLQKVYFWKWASSTKDTLNAYVKGTRDYTVAITYMHPNSVTESCSCPEYALSDECKHCAAVFLTVVEVFKDPHVYSTLHALLMNDLADCSDSSIVVCHDPQQQATILSCSPDIDPMLADLVNKFVTAKNNERKRLHLDQLIEKSVNQQLLRIETEAGTVTPTAISQRKVRKRVACIAQGKKSCILKPLLEYEDGGKKIEHFTSVSREYMLDHETGMLVKLNNNQRYDIWDIFYDTYALRRDDTLIPAFSKARLVAHNSFYSYPLWLVTQDQHQIISKTVFLVNTQNKPAQRYITPDYSIHLEADAHTGMVQGILAVRLGANTIKIHDLFIAWYDRISQECKELKVSESQFFPAIVYFLSRTKYGSENGAIDEILQDTLKTIPTIKQLGPKRAVSHLLEMALSITKDFLETPQFLYTAGIEEAIIYTTLVPKNLMIVLLEAFQVWGDKIVLTPGFQQGIFKLTKKDLQGRIRKYFKIAHKYKVSVFLDKKRVKVAKTSFLMNAKKNNFDWFMIDPEIRLDSTVLSRHEIIPFLESGQHETVSSVELVDDESEVQFNFLKKYFGKKEKLDTLQESAPSIVELRPLKIFELIDFKANGITLKLPKEEQEVLDSLGRFKKLTQAPLPKNMQLTLRNYQHEGFSWLLFLYTHKFGACLADDMGLGKTVQAITFLAALYEMREKNGVKKPHLIVVPPSLVFNWLCELKKFCPALIVQEYLGTSRDEIPLATDIIITTYDIIRIDREKFEKHHFDVIIFDEAQMIKNITAKRTSAVRRLAGNFKLTLTGTPLENNISEFYSIMDLTLPGLLVDFEEFSSWEHEYQVSYMVERSRPFILRRKKEVILHDLPEKTEHDMYLPMNQQQKVLYQKVVNEIKDTISSAYQEKTAAQATIIALTALLRLRQICVSPELIIPAYKELSPKLAYLIEKISELATHKHAALVFSQFTSCLDLIEAHLEKEKIAYLRIDGTVPTTQRKAIIEKFQHEKSTVTVLLLSLKTGGVGLNLTRANYVFHVDPWWNPAVENQASDRAYRLGQKQPVFVTRLLMHHSIEEKMMHLKKEKADLFAAVLENTQVKRSTALAKKDFDFLLT